MIIAGSYVKDAQKGDIVLLEDRALVCIKNQPHRGIVWLTDTDDTVYYYSYTAEESTVIERVAASG